MSGLDCPTREEVRAIECPACGAGAGELCVEPDGAPRENNHMERLRAVKRAAAERSLERKRRRA